MTTATSGRRARALVGWMEEKSAYNALLGQANAPITDEVRRAVESAHRAVEARAPASDLQSGVLQPMPSSLSGHGKALRDRPAAAPYFSEGWEVEIIDLRRVVAFQPQVVVDDADGRIENIKKGDWQALAALTLPAQVEQQALKPSLDAQGRVWTLTSENPNMRIVGQFAGPMEGAPPGGIGLGFVVAMLPSFVQAAHIADRWVLRDGYHRAIGLLRAGFNEVPVFVHRSPQSEQLVPPGMLSIGAFLGERPPLLTDYLDDSVSADIRLPGARRLVAIQALEVGYSD